MQRDGRERRRAPGPGRLLAAGALGVLGLLAAACTQSAGPASTSSASVNTLIADGQAAQDAGQASLAQTYYDEALAKAPTNATARYDLADLEQLVLGEPAEAEANYRKALAAAPGFTNAWFNLAILLTPTKPAEAAADYRKVIALDPKGSAAAHLNLGFLLRSEGQIAAGNAELRTAVRLDPSLAARVAGILAPTGRPATPAGTSGSSG